MLSDNIVFDSNVPFVFISPLTANSYDLKNMNRVDKVEPERLKGETNAFTLETPDFEKSPLTGMTRQHWLDAAKFLTDGVFQHVSSIDDTIVLPKQNEIIIAQYLYNRMEN